MQRWRGIDNTPSGWGRCVVTIGMYDGVHRGHQRLIGRAVEVAAELDLPSVVVTFDPHPSEVVRPGSHPPILTGPRYKAQLIESLGVDALCVLPFTLEFSRLGADEFVHEALVDKLHAAAVVVGENFRFGHKAAGDVDLLRRLGTRFGFRVEGVALVGEGDVEISSTYVRACVAAGDVVAASRALGRDHRVEGIVVRGANRGAKELGFPTANLETSPHTAVPGDGVYAGRFVHRGQARAAAISVGTNPTFSGQQRTVEAFVLDFDGDLYGEHAAIEFVERLRGQERYDNIDDLIEQMHKDVARTRTIVG